MLRYSDCIKIKIKYQIQCLSSSVRTGAAVDVIVEVHCLNLGAVTCSHALFYSGPVFFRLPFLAPPLFLANSF